MLPKDFDDTEYEKIISSITKDKQCVILSGSAGTGKTTFIEYLQSDLGKQKLPLANNMIIVASTGIAAMQAGGTTIHSFFRFPPESYDFIRQKFAGGDEIKSLFGANAELIKNLQLLVIDEVSMVRADLMDALDASLKINRRRYDLPFGGVRVILVGDIFQLQPVVSDSDSQLLSLRYKGSSGAFFFSSNVIQELISRKQLDFVELKIPRRFTHLEDKELNFYDILNRIRMGNTSDLEMLNKYLSTNGRAEMLLEQNAVMLTGRRVEADARNKSKLQSLDSEEIIMNGISSGKCDTYKDSRLPVPRLLCFKKDAQVVFIKNNLDGLWKNGSVGSIIEIGSDDDGEFILVKLVDNEQVVRVYREVWEVMDYKYDKKRDEIVATAVGSYSQFPLLLAWAMTIHRAQGKTISRAVINLQSGAFSAGQAYVALSRCREAKDMAFSSPLNYGDIICHPEVSEFYMKMKENYEST